MASSHDSFTNAIFDAYLPDKWSSNVYTRERLESKQRLMSLAKRLEPVLAAKGLELQRQASDEYPSLWNQKKVDAQWVFFWRNEEDRRALEAQVDLEGTLAATLADPTPMLRHGFICLKLEKDSLELGLRVHREAWVDRRNVANKIADETLMAELVELFQGLPEPTIVGTPGGSSVPAAQCTAEVVERVVSTEEEDFLFVGVSLGRQETLDLGGDLAEFLSTRLEGIADIYRFAAWSPSNNHVRADEKFEQSRAARGARKDELDAGSARFKSEHEAKQQEGLQARQELEELFRRESAARAAAPRRPRPSADDSSQPPIRGGKEDRRQPDQGRSGEGGARPRKPQAPPKLRRAEPIVEPSEPIPVEVGHRAKVTGGPLAGQIGTVQDIDSHGNARVMVGLLASRVPVDELFGFGPPPEKK